MGCVSSKALKKNFKPRVLLVNAEVSNHVVSLTSSTYGALKLDQDPIFLPPTCNLQHIKETHQGEVLTKKKNQVRVVVPKVEVINTWELMSDLEDETTVAPMSSNSSKKEVRSPFKRVSSLMSNNLVSSPKGVGKLDGKENKGGQINQIQTSSYTTPRGRVFKPWKFSTGSNDRARKLGSGSPGRRSNSGSRRRSLGPLFDPELIDSFEKELSQEEEQIKKMVSPKECSMLDKYEKLCPPGGEECVVIYTTTLRGIRKTFEDCNVVRSAIESYQIRVIERDISMDSGFKEELRKLMGKKDVKVPAVFVKGRLIGGANEVIKLDEEGRLEGLLAGISKGVLGCQGCGGIRFVMCMECNGSCKVLDERHRCMVRCGECNENGLVHCPLCSSIT
ncbi:uncharacterized protein At3g28850 [Silene latifolia]|uniref:uncharacterized protein At3g28850 n=1 Tax=Silene latifolia TaxID=37657 RepID=UPI003D76B1C4